MRNKIPGELLIFLAALSWSLIGVLVKSVDVSVTWLALVRSLAAALALLPFAVRAKLKPDKTMFITGFFYAMLCLTFTSAARLGTVTMAISMQYAAPVYLLFYTMIKEKQFFSARLLPFLFLFFGLLLSAFGAGDSFSPLASILGVLTGLSFLFYGIFLKRVDSTSPFGTISIINLFAVFFFTLMLPLDFSPAPTTPQSLITLILFGVFISGFSYVLYSAGLASVPLQRGLLITLAEMVLSPIWVLLIVGEMPPWPVALGLLLVIIGCACEVLLPSFKKKWNLYKK